MPHRAARADGLGSVADGVRVDPVVPVEVRDRAALPEMLNTERLHPVAIDAADPGKRRRVAVDHGDQPAVARQRRKKPLNVAHGVDDTALPRPLGRLPPGIQPIGGGDGEHANITAVLAEQACGADRLRRDRALIGDHHLGVRAGPPAPNKRR